MSTAALAITPLKPPAQPIHTISALVRNQPGVRVGAMAVPGGGGLGLSGAF